MSQKIVPSLWFDNNAEEAAKFYVSVFNNSRIGTVMRYSKSGAEVSGMPEGTVMTIEWEIEGYKFIGINGGPIFKLNPSVSFHVKCKTKEEVDEIWEKLSEYGTVLMELEEYPFSERYGWVQDKYGVSWQVIFAGENMGNQKITPALMFTENAGKAEEAINFYASVFPDSKTEILARYEKGEEPDKEGTVKYASFTLFGQEFGAMDSAQIHKFSFNEAASLLINCENQEEIDHYWNKLTEGGQESVCGWLKDKYRFSWQVAPRILDEMIKDKNKDEAEKAMKAMLQMKKIIIKDLEEAYNS